MKSIQDELQRLDFHDSTLRVVAIEFSDGNARSCTVLIDYYDWQGNLERREADAASEWRWKRLRIHFGYLAHIEYSAPDFINRAQDIMSLEVGYNVEWLREKRQKFKKEFPRGRYPLFDDGSEVVSARFETQNFTDEGGGYLWVVGTKVRLDWLEGGAVGQIHIPIAGP